MITTSEDYWPMPIIVSLIETTEYIAPTCVASGISCVVNLVRITLV